MGRCKWRLCTKGFRKFVWHLYEAFLNLIKHFQMLSNYNTAISFFVNKHSWNINTQYLNFCNPGRIFSSLFLIGSLLNVLATEQIKTLQMLPLELFDQYGNSSKFLICLGVLFWKFWYLLNFSIKHLLAWRNSTFIIAFLTFG